MLSHMAGKKRIDKRTTGGGEAIGRKNGLLRLSSSDRGEIPLALLWSSQVNAPVTNAPCSFVHNAYVPRLPTFARVCVYTRVCERASERASADISRACYLGQTGWSNVRLFPCLPLRARSKKCHGEKTQQRLRPALLFCSAHRKRRRPDATTSRKPSSSPTT